MPSRFPDRNIFFTAGTGIAGIVCSALAADFHHLSTLLMLLPLLVVVEWFPIRVGRFEYLGSFPILYTMAVTAGYPATALFSVCLLVVTQYLRRKSFRSITLNGTIRVISLLVSGFFTAGIQHLLPVRHSQFFLYNYLNLLLSVFFFTVLSHSLTIIALRLDRRIRKRLAMLFEVSLLDIGLAVAYDGLMIWLAYNPRNTSSGPLGTLFFFLPLAAMMIVLHLITNLTRTKRGLETLFAVSQSINQQWDVPVVFSHVMKEAKRLLQSTFVRLYIKQEDGSWRVEGDGVGRGRIFNDGPVVRILSSLISPSGEPLVVHDVKRNPKCPCEVADDETQSMMWVPIQTDDKVVGVISLGRKETFGYRADDVKFMSIFATHASVALKNALFLQEREHRLILEERNRLAREIHDGLAQNLAGAVFQIEMMRRTRGEHWESDLENLQSVLLSTVSTVRESIYALRPQPYVHLGLIPAIRSHLEEVRAQYGLVTHIAVTPDEPPWSADLSKVIFAIVTESIQNVLKHANATEIWVTIYEEGPLVKAQIRDNGRGFQFSEAVLSASGKHSFGIENMYELAGSVDGSLDFLTAPGEGTLVVLEIPLSEVTYDNQRITM